MALPQLTWKLVSYVTGSLTTVEDILNGIYDALAETTYNDGSTRTPGTGSAWTRNRYQDTGVTEAVYIDPPAAAISDFQVILAGQDSATKTPTLLSPDVTFTAPDIYLGINKDSGAFNAWDNAAPFTSGSFSGFSKAWEADLDTIEVIHIIESEEAICITLEDNDGETTSIIAGAWINPCTTDIADAESNDRVYSMAHASPADGNNNTHVSSPAGLLMHNPVANSYHCGMFEPGSSNWITIRKVTLDNFTPNHFTSRSGKITGYPIMMRVVTGTGMIGVCREIYYSEANKSIVTATEAGATKGHFLGNETDASSSGGTFFFRTS